MDWLIRDVGGSDLDELARLAERCLGDGWGRPALAETLERPVSRMRIACDEGGEPFGFVVARRVAEIIEIDLLGVAPERRREGCARALLEDLIEREVARGAEEARLELRESNRSARALYAGLGFVVVGTRSRYYPDGEDATLLTRRSEPPRSLEPPFETGTES